MGVVITDIRWNNNYRTSQDLSFLLACIAEKVVLEIDFDYEDIVFRTTDNILTVAPLNADVNLADTTDVIQSEDGNAFADYAVGDTIKIFDNSVTSFTSHTVTEIINSGLIRVNTTFTNQILIVDSYIYNITPFAGVRYAYNLLDVGSGFNSLIDGEYQNGDIDTASATNLSNQSLSFTGIKSYQIGTLQIKGRGLEGLQGATGGGNDDIKQKFTITHNTVITPFFLADQHPDLLLSIKPDYFTAQATLNYSSEISFGRDLTNPNGLQVLPVPNIASNVGWFNERFNGGVNNYFVDSLTLTDVAAGSPVSQLEFGKEIQIDIVIKNTVDTPFSSGNTNYTFGFNYLPDDEADYQENGFDQTRNFLFDSLDNVIGAGSANGTNFGTDLQVIKTVTSTFTSSSEIKITVVIDTGTDADAIIQAGDLDQYQIWLITENHANSAETSDKVNLLVQVNSFFTQLTTANLIEGDDILYLQHPFVDFPDTIKAFELFLYTVDDVVAWHKFHINFATHPASEGIKIISVNSKILMRDDLGVEADFLLETFQFGTAGFPIVAGQAQDIDFTQDRVFKIPDGVRKEISLQRDFASDVADDLFFDYKYPFMKRWEFWKALTTPLTAPPAGIFDNTQPLNGLNNFWHRYTTVLDWDMFYIIDYVIEQNGVQFTQTFTSFLEEQHDFLDNSDWTLESIKTFDINSPFGELTNGTDKFVKGYENVKVEASFTKTSGPIPALANVGMVIWIETFEAGGIEDIRRISSFYPISINSWFKSTDTSDKVVITNPSAGVFVGEALVDFTKLPTNQKFTMYARLYEFFNPLAKQFETSNDFEFETVGGGGALYEFE